MKKSELRELIREQVRNLIKEASVSQEAYVIHSITKCGQDAAQNFIDDNKLDGKKLAAYVRQHSNSKEKYDVRDIIAGTGVGANVGFKSRFLKQFKESVIKEAREYSFTFDYNTDPDDIEYIENLLKKARVNAYAEQGTFDDEMVVIAGDAIELRKAKKAIEADGFQINEAILNAPEQKEWPLKFNINYDDLPANLDLRTASLNKLFQGIPYQHLAWPEVSDDGAFIFKTAEDLAKAKQVLGLKESKLKEVNELTSYKIGDKVKFSNGEVWKVAKPGVKGDKIFLAPFNSIAKKGHISLPIEFTQDELKDTVTESINEAANDISYINKARAKSSLEQIKKGKRSDGMGKFDAKVYAIKGTQEIELTDPSDLAKYSVGYKYGLKNESVVNEADMTRMYDGFKVLNDKTKKMTKFRYVKGRKNTDVENEAIAKLMKATGLTRPNFGVHGFVRKGEWESDKAEIFKESVLKESKDVKSEVISRLADFFRVSPYALSKFNFDGTDDIKELTKALNSTSDQGTKLYYDTAIKAAKRDLGIQESVLKEALIGPFAISASTPDDELIAMYHAALDGFANYKTGMYFKKSEYKLAYQTIEKILQKKGVAITEADDPEAGEAAPYGSGYAEVNEDAGMVVDVAMGVAAGLMGLWALVQGAPLVGRVFGDAAEYLAAKLEKKAKMALKNQRKETIAPIIAKFKNDQKLADMYQALPPYDVIRGRDFNGRRKALTAIGKYIKSKLTPEEMTYFRDISAMLRDGDLKESVLTENQLTASVISVGIINMTNGKTAHGWSIYENKGLYAFLTSGNYLLLATKDSFKVGDEVELIGNDSGRRLSKKHKIVDISECIKDELLKMLKSNGFDYSPLRAFKARPAGNKKLQTSFSVKGIQ